MKIATTAGQPALGVELDSIARRGDPD